MKKTKLLLLACLLTLVGWNATAQRVIAYHQGSNNDKLQDWYWNYVTDINYAFLQISSTGTVGLAKDAGPDNFNFETNRFNAFLTIAKAKGKRVSISVGGASATQAANFKTNAATYDKARNLAKNVVAWVKTNGLNGIDIDWEPEGTTGKPTSTEWENLAKAFRDEITANGQGLELSAAVFPYKWNNDFVSVNSYQYFDHISLMVYDFGAPDYPHHSNMIPNADNVYGGKTVEEACISYWNKKGLAKDKMVLGLPFYARPTTWTYNKNDYKLYRDIANTTTAQADQSGTWMYNGQPTIKRKTKYAIANGLKGVMAWELVGDATDKSLSLLAAIDAEITAAGCPKPNLGDNQNMCTKASIKLDATLSANDYSFTWYKDNVQQPGTDKTFTATAPGVYKVVAKKNGTTCFQESIVTLESTYPEIDVKDVPLCGAGDAIDVDATIKGFEGMTYKWTGTATASTAIISINKIGNYTVTVSDPAKQCASKTKTIVATESSVKLQGDTVCTAGEEVKLKILDSGTFSWWTAKTGGTQLGTLDSLYQKITKTTPFYVQKTGGAIQYTAGVKYDHAAPADATSGPGKGDYEWASSGFDDVRIYFTVVQELTIDEFVANLDLGSGSKFTGKYNVCLYDGDLKQIQCVERTTETNGKNTVAVGFTVAPGNYYIGIPDAKQWKEAYVEGKQPFDYTKLGITDVITFNSTVMKSEQTYKYAAKNWYAGFYDWKISTGKPCPRVEVFGVVDAANKKCIKINPVATITAPADKYTMVPTGNVDLVATATDQDGTVASVKFVVKNSQGIVTKELTGTKSSSTYKVNLSGLAIGTYTVNAIATDNQGLTGVSASITITVANANKVPTVSFVTPNNNAQYSVDGIVDLSVLAADDDGEADIVKVVYTIKNGTSVITTLEATDINTLFSQTWKANQAGTITIEAKVFDKAGATGTATVTITVKSVTNANPTVTITSPKNASSSDVNATTTITSNATDADGTVVKVEYSIKFAGATVATKLGVGSSYTVSFVADKAGEYTIIATATDDKGATGTNQVTFTAVTKENQLPVVTVVEPANTSIKLPNNVNFKVTATDADGTIASVTISINNQNLTVSNSGSSYSATWNTANVSAGKYTATIVATDNQGGKTTKTVDVTIVAENQNVPPTIVIVKPTSTISISINETTAIETTITDDSKVASVTINGKAITASGNNYNTTFSSATAGTFNIDVVATDDKGAKTTKTITIIVNEPANQLPVVTIVEPANTSVKLPSNVNFKVTATDADGTIASVTIAINNQNLTVSNSGSSYSATWNTANVSAGKYTATIVATDNKGGKTTKTVDVTIVAENQNVPPTIVIVKPTSTISISINETTNIETTITDSDGSVASVTINGKSITASGNNYNTTFSSATAGTFNIDVVATDDKGSKTTKTVSIKVIDPNNTDATISDITTEPTTIRENTATTVKVTATDPEGIQTVDMKVKDQNGKETTISSTTSGTTTTGSWTPTTAGTYTITVTVTDKKGATTTKTKTVTVSGQSGGVVLNPLNLKGDVKLNTEINISASATGATKLTYEISKDGALVEIIDATNAPNFGIVYKVQEEGTYTIVAYASDAPNNKSNTETFVASVNSIAEANAIKLNYTVFPNPATNNASISFTLEESAMTNVTIYNAQGAEMMNVINEDLSADTHTFEMNINELPAGLYFIQLITGDTLAIQRLIVE